MLCALVLIGASEGQRQLRKMTLAGILELSLEVLFVGFFAATEELSAGWLTQSSCSSVFRVVRYGVVFDHRLRREEVYQEYPECMRSVKAAY